MNNIQADSLERKKYHEWIIKTIPLLNPGSIVYDIGKSHKYNYASVFNNHIYNCIDNNLGKLPVDIFINFENATEVNKLAKADLVLCNGVTEQCNNPFNIIDNCKSLVKDSGLILYGSVLTGFPVYDNDNFRFTEKGIKRMFKNIIDFEVIRRENIVDPTYIYLLCRRD